MTTPIEYRSTDPSAPALSGTVGSGIAWLKACLVGDSGGVAYGAGATQKMAAGWTVAFEDFVNHICVFRNSLAAGGSGCYLRVDDGGSGAGGAREMLVRMYSSMSDVNSGVDPTPTVAQRAAGIVWRKSISLTSDARAAILVADARTLSLSIHPGYQSSGSPRAQIMGHAGDYACYDAAQPCPFVIGGSVSPSASTTWGGAGPGMLSGIQAAAGSSVSEGLYCGRAPGGAVGALGVGIAIMSPSASSSPYIGSSGFSVANPDPAGLTQFYPALLRIATSMLGHLRGLAVPINNLSADEMGKVYPDAAGAGIGSSITVLAHHGGGNDAATGFGRIGVETKLEW